MPSQTHRVGPADGLRVVDAGNNDNYVSTGIAGTLDTDQADYIEAKINRFASFRAVEMRSKNDAFTADEIPTLFAALAQHPDWYVFDEDFLTGPATDDTTSLPLNWAAITDYAGPAIDSTDGAGGWARVHVDSTDNDETYISSLGENWLFAASKPLIFMCKFKHTAGSTDGKSSFVVGLSDTVAADSIVDAGTLMTSYDGCVFFKDEDGSHILFASSNATTQDSADLVAWVDADVFEGGFIFDPGAGTTGTLTPFYLTTASDWSTITMGTAQSITLSGLAEMHLLLGAKTHEANLQDVDVDYVKVIAKR